MADKSKIEWTDSTWNPVTGCTKVSQGCKHCYAERTWKRLAAPGQPYAGRAFTDIRCHPERLDQPLRWRLPRRIFVNSMSDLFHPDVPDSFIDQVFAVMVRAQRHNFQVLTKRPKRMLAYFSALAHRAAAEEMSEPSYLLAFADDSEAWEEANCVCPRWPLPNVWLGVSVEDQDTAEERIPLLLETPAAVRWVSAEPLIGPIDLRDYLPRAACGRYLPAVRGVRIPGLDWIVAGGESGPGARPTPPDWVRSLRDQCQAAGAPFFFKQWGQFAPRYDAVGREHATRIGKRRAGRELDGRTWNQYPMGQNELARR